MTFFTNYSVSQNTLSTANNNTIWKTQGNAADTNAFMGTTNSTSLRFKTNNIERMRIGEGGYVGIGVEDPQFPLDLEGDFQLTGDIIFNGYEDLQNPLDRFLMIDNTGRTKTRGMNQMKAIFAWEDCFDILYDFPYPDGGSSTIIAGTYSTWGSRIEGQKSILYTGSECPAWVGIGTDLPMTKLDVRGSGRFSQGIKVGNITTVHAGLYIENYGQTNNPYFDKLILVKDHENNTKMHIEKSNNSERLQIKLIPNPNSGNFIFEISQANPKGTLYVYGLDGKLYYQQAVIQSQTRLNLSLKNGLYLVVYRTTTEMQTTKLIIN